MQSLAQQRLEAAAQLAAVLTTESRRPTSSHIIARDVLDLMRIARRMENLALRQCNGPWDDAADKRAEKARERALEKIKSIGASYGIKSAHVHGDPRGFVVRVDFKSGRQNGFGDGWGVLGA